MKKERVTQGDWGVVCKDTLNTRCMVQSGIPGFSIDGVGLVGLGGELGETSSSSPWDGLLGWRVHHW